MSGQNRQERRRQARRKTPVVIAGDGIVATELPGHQFEGRPRADLPVKVPGKHRWIAMVTYVLNDIQARDALDESIPKFLDAENLHYLAIGCWDCEAVLGDIQADSRCPAPGDDP